MQQGNTPGSEEYTPIRLTIWCETEPTSTARILQADLEKRCIPATLEVRRRFVLRHFEMGLYQEVYAVVRPFVPGTTGIDINEKTIDAIADLLTGRFTPKQAGITHTIFILGRHGSVIRCLELKNKGAKDITERWEKRRPSFCYTTADDEGYVSCLRCHAAGTIGGFLSKTRQCPRCLGKARVLKALVAGSSGHAHAAR